MSKQIVNSDTLKVIAKNTIEELSGIVKKTLGPGGNPILIKRSGQNPDGTPKTPLITKDGVTVAENISFSDPVKNTIAQAIIQVSKDTVNSAGDGTTSSVVLAEAIYLAGYKHIEQGKNSILLYEELKSIKDEVMQYLDEVKKEVNVESVYRVAEISSNGDKEVARIVQEAIEAVGEDGHITLEENVSRETVLDVVEGAVYKQGYRTFGHLGSLMISDKAKDICEMSDAAVVLFNGKLDDVHQVAKFIGNIYKAEGNQVNDPFPILFVANDYSNEVKDMLMANRAQAKLPIAAIKTPFDGSPNARTGILDDLATLTGATVSAKGFLELDKLTEEHLGGADKIEIGANDTVIFGGKGSEGEVLERVNDLKRLLDSTPHEIDKANLRVRIGKLTGGISVIRVGGDSELEILEKKDRIEDALCAAKVALQDGIVPGGGVTLLKWALTSSGKSSDARDIMVKALQAPFNQIVANVGEIPEVVLHTMLHSDFEGYNARTKELVQDMVQAGIIDPVKVTKSALENAVSIAGLLLTTGGAITDEPVNSLTDGSPNPLAGMKL